MRVVRLALTPVKGCRQRDVREASVTEHGLAGDRTHLFVSGTSALRTVANPGLLALDATVTGDTIMLTLPDGTVAAQAMIPVGPTLAVDYWGRGLPARTVPGPVSDAAAAHLNRDAVLAALEPPHRAIYAEPVSVLFLSELAALPAELADPARFRANVVVDDTADPRPETHRRAGVRLRLGDAELRLEQPLERCGLVDVSPATGRRDAAVFAALPVTSGRRLLAWGATVVRPGRVARGDRVAVCDGEAAA